MVDKIIFDLDDGGDIEPTDLLEFERSGASFKGTLGAFLTALQAGLLYVEKDGDTMTGPLRVPVGLVSAPGLQVGAIDIGFFNAAANVLSAVANGARWNLGLNNGANNTFLVNQNLSVDVRVTTAVDAHPFFQFSGLGTDASLLFSRWSTGTGGPRFTFAKSLGTALGIYTAVGSGAVLGELSFAGADGTRLIFGGALMMRAIGTTTADNISTEFRLQTQNAGVTVTGFTQNPDGSLAHGAAANIFLDALRHFRLRSYTIATLPTASPAGQVIQCSDLGGGAGELVSDGAAWRRVNPGQQNVTSNADFTLTPLTSAEIQRHTGTLTGDRTITLSPTRAYAGARFLISRTGSGNFNLIVGGLVNLAQNTFCEVAYDGAAWYLSKAGLLVSPRRDIVTTFGANAAQTFTPGLSTVFQNSDTTALTANRDITLSNTGAVNGDEFKVKRNAGGAFNMNVKNHDGTLLIALGGVGMSSGFKYDGINWISWAS